MNRTQKVVLLTGVLVTIAVSLYIKKSRRNTNNQLKHVADEGYETAYDVLYPGSKSRRGKQHYGPVWGYDL